MLLVVALAMTVSGALGLPFTTGLFGNENGNNLLGNSAHAVASASALAIGENSDARTCTYTAAAVIQGGGSEAESVSSSLASANPDCPVDCDDENCSC